MNTLENKLRRIKLKTVLEILSEIRKDIDFKKEDKLIDDGVIDSIDIVSIIMALSENYNIEIPTEELKPENFNSVYTIEDMIKNIIKN